MPREGQVAKPLQEEGRRTGRVLLLLGRVEGARERPCRVHCTPIPVPRRILYFYHLLSNLSVQKSGLISMGSSHKYLLTTDSEPKKGSS